MQVPSGLGVVPRRHSMHCPVLSRNAVPPVVLFAHGSKMQWPVASALFPEGQMHVPIMISPPMQGGGDSAEGAGTGAGALDAEMAGAGPTEADAETVADAMGETEADAASGAGSGTGAGTTGA